jgi:hypothetical protein
MVRWHSCETNVHGKSMHATSETFAIDDLPNSQDFRESLVAQSHCSRAEAGSQTRTRILFSRANTASPFPREQSTPTKQHIRPENTMTSRPDVESTETTSPPQRRTGARRGPRVSNACVNCRRRKVCGIDWAGFPFRETYTAIDTDFFVRSSVRARSRGVSTAPRTRSIACMRNLLSGKGLFCSVVVSACLLSSSHLTPFP